MNGKIHIVHDEDNHKWIITADNPLAAANEYVRIFKNFYSTPYVKVYVKWRDSGEDQKKVFFVEVPNWDFCTAD